MGQNRSGRLRRQPGANSEELLRKRLLLFPEMYVFTGRPQARGLRHYRALAQ